MIGDGEPVFIIAEAGVNHNGDLDLAKKLILAAKKAGADSVKFQTFKAENLNTRHAPKSTYHIETTGAQGSWFDLLKTQELDRRAHEVLIDCCQKAGILFLSTPYDEESADLLDDLGVLAFKVASTDANNIPFLKYLARKKKPILLSTAMCTLDEVKESVDAVACEGCRDLVLFHCTANYPAKPSNANLRAMQTLAREFGVPAGYSDHIPENLIAVAAVGAGATAYEKHFTLDKTLPGPDHRASLEPSQLKELVEFIRKTEIFLGRPEKRPLEAEKENRTKLRKSIVARRNLKAGEKITPEAICVKRPATGLAPKFFDELLGKTLNRDLEEDELVRWEDVG